MFRKELKLKDAICGQNDNASIEAMESILTITFIEIEIYFANLDLLLLENIDVCIIIQYDFH